MPDHQALQALTLGIFRTNVVRISTIRCHGISHASYRVALEWEYAFTARVENLVVYFPVVVEKARFDDHSLR
jgi:hypothetical protein